LARRLIIRKTSLVSIRLLVRFVPLADAAEQPALLISADIGGFDPAVQIFAKAMMARHLVALTAILVQPQPPALFVFKIITDTQGIGRTHAGEAENHQPNQSLVARPDELTGIDGIPAGGGPGRQTALASCRGAPRI
jgi:hypothetical protein